MKNNNTAKIIGNTYTTLAIFVAAIGFMLASSAQAGSPSTPGDRFTNIDSIANTRHNMTNSTAPAIIVSMQGSRNNYGEVCVYCHTPHAANTTIAAPLWNRTIRATSYLTYDQLETTTLTQTVSQPGPASLTCLSCHDGQTAIDSVINMPGSGMGLLSQQTTQNTAFLNSWPPGCTPPLFIPLCGPQNHLGFNSNNGGPLGDGQGSTGCLSCHNDPSYGGVTSGYGPDFRMALIGTDLRNDHPIGVTFPAPLGSPKPDWNTPAKQQGSSAYFVSGVDNSRMDKNEIRTYDGKVECASCHDPHGVPSMGPGSQFNATFLRKSQSEGGLGSAVCLTCHNK